MSKSTTLLPGALDPASSGSSKNRSGSKASSQCAALVYPLLQEQTDQIMFKKTLKLNGILTSTGTILATDVVECIHDFISSYDPPLEIVKLSLQNNQMVELPDNMYLISKSVTFLDLHKNNLISLADSALNARDFPHLEILDLSCNNLSTLPKSFVRMQTLKVLSLKDNYFKYLPPVLGDLSNLNLIEINNNPLINPSMDVIKGFQLQRGSHDWVDELKAYLYNNRMVLEQKIIEQLQKSSSSHHLPSQPPPAPPSAPSSSLPSLPTPPNFPIPMGPIPSAVPALTRSKSISETKSKASRAARRMGLIIKKSGDEDTDNKSAETDEAERYSSLPHSGLFGVDGPPTLSDGTTSIGMASSTPTSLSSSPLSTPVASRHGEQPKMRSRANTMKEIDKILEKNETLDTEHKSGAYFRRLSTLRESPSDETSHFAQASNTDANTTRPRAASAHQSQVSSLQLLAQQPSLTTQLSQPTEKATRIVEQTPERPNGGRLVEVSPTKVQNTAKRHGTATLIKVSRKVLFAFSELHSSIRRFTGFCVDKKVTVKMVSHLYATKTHIDSLVEHLEIVEENNEGSMSASTNSIIVSLHSCIGSFKSIMALLSDNYVSFIAKIDPCFIRMLYLTLYGSLNELLNAYKLLQPAFKPPPFNVAVSAPPNLPPTSSTPGHEKPQKLAINTGTPFNTDDVDEKLYRAIEISTTNAQVVFGEITKAINKSAIESAMASSGEGAAASNISHTVASKVKDLTSVCMTSMDVTRILKTKLITIRNNPSQATKKMFWDDINMFLKAIIQTFSAVKGVMKDLPVLNDIRASMANLTKTTKDVTILLEVSSYKSMSVDPHGPSLAAGSSAANIPPMLPSVPSVSNIFTPLSAQPPQSSLSSFNWSQASTTSLRGPSSAQHTLLALSTDVGKNIPGPTSAIAPSISSNVFASPVPSPGGGPAAMSTAPAQSTGQYFAKNGMNPFDGLIMATKAGEEKE